MDDFVQAPARAPNARATAADVSLSQRPFASKQPPLETAALPPPPSEPRLAAPAAAVAAPRPIYEPVASSRAWAARLLECAATVLAVTVAFRRVRSLRPPAFSLERVSRLSSFKHNTV